MSASSRSVIVAGTLLRNAQIEHGGELRFEQVGQRLDLAVQGAQRLRVVAE